MSKQYFTSILANLCPGHVFAGATLPYGKLQIALVLYTALTIFRYGQGRRRYQRGQSGRFCK